MRWVLDAADGSVIALGGAVAGVGAESSREFAEQFLATVGGCSKDASAASCGGAGEAKELARKDGERRKAGGQPGHPGAGRGLLPEDRMQEIVDHYPDQCGGCRREFTDSEKVPRHGPGRHQVAELPPTAVVYTEHRAHRLRCPGCRERTRATLGTISESAFGPGLQAAVVALTARNRISRRDMSFRGCASHTSLGPPGS